MLLIQEVGIYFILLYECKLYKGTNILCCEIILIFVLCYPIASLETNTSNTIETSPFDITSKESSMEQHICNICKRTFPGSDMLKKHSKSHTNTSHCAACGQDFQDRLALAKHQTEVRTY
jgi:hypothetical protein